jgi:DNA polymerase I-like protein with 3'-5' exonuclease and polymerase domains
VPRYRNRLVADMRANHGMFVNPFGRPRRIPMIMSRNRGDLNRATRMAMASMVSGTAADMNKEIILRTAQTLQAHYANAPVERRGRLVQTIHDENVYDLPIAGCGPVIHALHADFVRWPLLESGGMPVRANVAVSSTTWEGKRDLELLAGGQFRLK